MADTKTITLYNKSRTGERVIYDANGQVHSFAPGQAKKVLLASVAAQSFGDASDAGDDLTTNVPNGVTVDDKSATMGTPDPEQAYMARNPAHDVESLAKIEDQKQAAAADALKAEGKPMVNAGNKTATSQTDAPDFDGMTVVELKEYAETNKIDLGDATKKADIIAKVKAPAAS